MSTSISSQPTVLGDFELRREIGRGGMGTVYEAWQRSLKRTVAVKVLGRQVSSSPSAVVRFQREAQAAAKLHHPHIIPIFALGEEEGTYYYAMEFIDGPGLNTVIAEARARQAVDTATSDLAETVVLDRAAKCEENGTDSGEAHPSTGGSDVGNSATTTHALSGIGSAEEFFTVVAEHIAAVADALSYAHQQGVVHRDIKPHNLILGSNGKMRISDFGLARLAEQPGVTITGELIGSPLYMSPEQITGHPGKVDHRTDICSLGTTMYEWLTLKPPYPGETREQVISKILTSEPLSLRTHNPNIPVDLETVCLRAIERDRHRRYQTAGELRDDLRRFIANRPIKARRAGLAIRIGKFIGRHQIASIAAAAAVVALALGLALVLTQRQVATQSASVEQADRVLDLFSRLPLEIGTPLRMAEAAVPILEDVVQSGQPALNQKDAEGSEGATPFAVCTPAGIARGAVRGFWEAVSGYGDPSSALGTAVAFSPSLILALEQWAEGPSVAVDFAGLHLREQPDHFEARQLRTALQGRLGQYDAMLEDAEELVRLRPEEPNVYVWRGLTHLLLGNSDTSLHDLNRAAEFDATSEWILAFRGLALVQAERVVEANSAFDDALQHEPDLVVALLGRASGRAALGNISGAVTDLTHVLEIEPDNADILALRGDRYVELNEYKDAQRDYQRAMDIAGQTPAMLVRYLFALAQERGPAGSDKATLESTGEAEVEIDVAETIDQSSSNRSWFDQLFHRLSPRQRKPRATETSAKSIYGGFSIVGLRGC